MQLPEVQLRLQKPKIRLMEQSTDQNIELVLQQDLISCQNA
jgi:hypothetical protein